MENIETSALLGLDIGTTNCKLAAFSTGGAPLASTAATYNLKNPQPGFVEIDPAELMAAVITVFRELAPKISGRRHLSLAISSQGEAFVLVDQQGNPLTPFPVSLDRRGFLAIDEFVSRGDVQTACEKAGQKLNSLSSLAKLLWFKQHAPQLIRQTSQLFCVGEYVMRSLGLHAHMDYSMASRTGFLDNYRRQWSQELISLSGLPASIFPPTVQSGFLCRIDFRWNCPKSWVGKFG